MANSGDGTTSHTSSDAIDISTNGDTILSNSSVAIVHAGGTAPTVGKQNTKHPNIVPRIITNQILMSTPPVLPPLAQTIITPSSAFYPMTSTWGEPIVTTNAIQQQPTSTQSLAQSQPIFAGFSFQLTFQQQAFYGPNPGYQAFYGPLGA